MNEAEIFIKNFIESFQKSWKLMEEIEKRAFVKKMLEDIDKNNNKDLENNDKIIENILNRMNEIMDKENPENTENLENVSDFLDVLSQTMEQEKGVLDRSNPEWEGENTLWTQNTEQFKKNLEDFEKNYPKKELIFSLPMGTKDFNELLSDEIRNIADSQNLRIQDDLDPLSLLSKADYGKLIEDYARRWVEEFNNQFIGDKIEIVEFNSLKNPIVKSHTNISEGRFLEYINETNLAVTEAVCENREWLSLDGIKIEGIGVIEAEKGVEDKIEETKIDEKIEEKIEERTEEIIPQNIPENNLENILNSPDNVDIDGKGMSSEEKEDVKNITDGLDGLINQGQPTQQKEQESLQTSQTQTQDTQAQSTQTQADVSVNSEYPNLSFFINQTRLKLKDKSYSKAQFKADFLTLCKSGNLNERETEVLSALTRGTILSDPQKNLVKEGYPLLLKNPNAQFTEGMDLLILSKFDSKSIKEKEIEALEKYAERLNSKPKSELRVAERYILEDLKKMGFLEKTQTQSQTMQKQNKNQNKNTGRGR